MSLVSTFVARETTVPVRPVDVRSIDLTGASALVRSRRIVLPLDRRVNRFVKALSDRLLAALAVMCAAPLMIAVAILVRITSTGPIIHRRRVTGRNGVEFDAFKFRTMIVNADAALQADAALRRAFETSFKLKHDPRVTPVGRFLRKLSLDELPQFLNVLLGQMSVVGPRMLSPEEVGRYGSRIPTLLSVKPGLTGLWQVSGRQRTTYERRIELDVQYVETWSPWLDLRILLKTPVEVFRGTGAF
jgi:lipopolysaccharide/colanic/teichoic acid biosynthesis glycosyltransferase